MQDTTAPVARANFARMLRWSIVVLAISLSVGAAAAAGTAAVGDAGAQIQVGNAEEANAEIERLVNGGHMSAALRAAREHATRFPDDVDLLFRLGTLLGGVNDYAPAITALRRAVELAPDVAGIHAQLGLILSTSGNYAGAEETVLRALELDPNEETAKPLLVELRTRQRLRAGIAPAEIPDGTPARAVADFIDLLRIGKTEQAFDRHVFRELLDGIAGELDAKADPKAFMKGVQQGFEKQSGSKVIGWEIEPGDPATNATAAEVIVNLLVEQRPSTERARQQQKMYESSAAETVLNADVLAFYRGLDPDDRRAMFERYGRITAIELIPMRLEMRRVTPGERWKVRDGAIGDPAVAILRLSQLAQFAKTVDPSLGFWSARSIAARMGEACNQGLGFGVVSLMMAWILVRRGRRKS
jgi:tetratricopeptide (TPR) repeat protein